MSCCQVLGSGQHEAAQSASTWHSSVPGQGSLVAEQLPPPQQCPVVQSSGPSQTMVVTWVFSEGVIPAQLSMQARLDDEGGLPESQTQHT